MTSSVEVHLRSMLLADEQLYERIMDTPTFAYHWNQILLIAKLAERDRRAEAIKLVEPRPRVTSREAIVSLGRPVPEGSKGTIVARHHREPRFVHVRFVVEFDAIEAWVSEDKLWAEGPRPRGIEGDACLDDARDQGPK